MNIKEELDNKGCCIIDCEHSGYNAYSLIFEYVDGIYSVTYHLSTESGYEEDLDSYVSDDFNKIVKYLKGSYSYEIH